MSTVDVVVTVTYVSQTTNIFLSPYILFDYKLCRISVFHFFFIISLVKFLSVYCYTVVY